MGLMALAPKTASVIISNHNYGGFVGNAIESALRQQHRPLEIIVVDDGSTDNSLGVISAFGARVRPVFKENGGQASALNAGCRIAQGEVVFLLDSDDLLKPDAVETVLASWKPETVMMHSRLDQVDAQGRATPGTVPAPWRRLDEGQVRDRLLEDGVYSTTVTSGLAFRRDVLQRVLPIPEDQFRQGADGYLVRAIAFHGPVQAIERPLASYRRHGQNYTEAGLTPAHLGIYFRRRIRFHRSEVDAVRSLAAQHGLEAAFDVGAREPGYLLDRLCSVVVDPDEHPIPGDTRLGLLPSVLIENARAKGRPAWRRVYVTTLAAAVGLLPRPVASRLVAGWHSSASRPEWLARLRSSRSGRTK